MIRVQSISKQFQGRFAVRDLSFEIATGEIIGLLGPNGAGKTTTLRMLAGYFPPTSGQIFVSGRDLWSNRIQAENEVGYLPENAPLDPQLTVAEFLSFVFELKNIKAASRKSAIQSVIHDCGLEKVQSRVIQNLSKGFRQRVALAQAMLGSPRFLILDEPTVGLDPAQIIEIRELIRNFAQGRTVLISSHVLPEVSALCSRVLIMNHGMLVASGKPDELAAELRRSGELVVRLRGRAESALELIKPIHGIIAARTEPSSANEATIFIRYKKSADLRAELAKKVIQSGCELLEMKEVSASLEEVFMKIILEESRS